VFSPYLDRDTINVSGRGEDGSNGRRRGRRTAAGGLLPLGGWCSALELTFCSEFVVAAGGGSSKICFLMNLLGIPRRARKRDLERDENNSKQQRFTGENGTQPLSVLSHQSRNEEM